MTEYFCKKCGAQILISWDYGYYDDGVICTDCEDEDRQDMISGLLHPDIENQTGMVEAGALADELGIYGG